MKYNFCMINNKELFEQFYKDANESSSISEKEGMSVKELSRKYDLTDTRIYYITKDERL